MVAQNNKTKFFVCSDSKQNEDQIKQVFGDAVICRSGKNYVSKLNPSSSWKNNVSTPLESLKDSLIDLIMLSNSTIKIYNPQSSFAQLALFIG